MPTQRFHAPPRSLASLDEDAARREIALLLHAVAGVHPTTALWEAVLWPPPIAAPMHAPIDAPIHAPTPPPPATATRLALRALDALNESDAREVLDAVDAAFYAGSTAARASSSAPMSGLSQSPPTSSTAAIAVATTDASSAVAP